MLRAAHHLLPIDSFPVLSILITNASLINNNNNNIVSSPFSSFSSRALRFNQLLTLSSQHFHSFITSTNRRSQSSIWNMSAHQFSTKTPSSASFSGDSSTGVSREILVQHLLVKEDDTKLLSELQKRIVQGEDMSDLAVDYSICPSKEEGGMLGWVRRGQMVPEFEEAAFGAPVNKVVKCKTKFGWHLLQVISEREESVLEDIQPHHLHEKLQDPCFLEEAQLIDVREPYEVTQASLPGFQVLPLRQFGNWGPEITTKFDPEKDTYVLCHHGVRSLQVAQWLQTQGFKKVFNVSGGIHAYALKVDPSIPTY